jgi:hypothetical protein
MASKTYPVSGSALTGFSFVAIRHPTIGECFILLEEKRVDETT